MLKENETSFSELQNATNQKTIEQNTLSPNRVIKKSKCFIYVGHLNVKPNTVLSQWENVFWEKMEKGKNMSMEKDHKIGDKRNVHEQRMWMIIVQMKRTSERRREKKDGREIEAKVRSHRRRWIELGDMKAIKTADTTLGRSKRTHKYMKSTVHVQRFVSFLHISKRYVFVWRVNTVTHSLSPVYLWNDWTTSCFVVLLWCCYGT